MSDLVASTDFMNDGIVESAKLRASVDEMLGIKTLELCLASVLSRSRSLCGSRGFTLLEMLCALLISTIVFTGWIKSRDLEGSLSLRKSVQAIGDAIGFAQSLSAISRKEVKVRFSQNEAVVVSSAPVRAGEEVIYRASIIPGSKILRASFGNLVDGRQVLSFRAQGTATPGSVSIIGRSGKVCTIYQSLYGARRMLCGQ